MATRWYLKIHHTRLGERCPASLDPLGPQHPYFAAVPPQSAYTICIACEQQVALQRQGRPA